MLKRMFFVPLLLFTIFEFKVESAIVEKVCEPLILTPLLKNKQYEDARSAARVSAPQFSDIAESYSGFITINETYNSNTFFWFFPAQKNYETAPVILYLEGGPGTPDIYTIFEQHGPFIVKEDFSVLKREDSWNRDFSVLYIDNPIGVGFSFTEDYAGFADSEEQIGEDVYELLVQFFEMFSELAQNDFYVAGESYGGKYVPSVGLTIHNKNQESDVKINLKGLIVGDGLSDPLNQLVYGEYFYQLGLIDDAQKKILEDKQKQIAEDIENGNLVEAGLGFWEIFQPNANGDSILKNLTGFDDTYNFLYSSVPYELVGPYYTFLDREDIRDGIHVGNASFDFSPPAVSEHLAADIAKSVAPKIAALLDHYPVLFYTGQLDIIVPYASTRNFLKKLNFSGADEYESAKRNIWYYGDEIAGYVKKGGNLVEAMIRNAGHLGPVDQPEWVYDLLSKFIGGKL